MESGELFASLQRGWQRGRTEAEQVVEQAAEGSAGGDDADRHPAHGHEHPAAGHEQHEQRADG